VESLRENGVSGFTIGDVVRRSGTSNGGLFRYFDTRTDQRISMLTEIAEHYIDFRTPPRVP
jgi:AcrR family transcriptional regulator